MSNESSLRSDPTDPAEAVGNDEFAATYRENLADTLNLDSWHSGTDLASLYSRLESEVAEAVRSETAIEEQVRETVFPRLATRPGAPDCAGVYTLDVADLPRLHQQVLFAGEVEACDGTSVVHDTLPVTIVQLGVALVSYHGDEGTWSHRLYRRDLRAAGIDPIEETLDLLDQRKKRAGLGLSDRRDQLTDLARRGLMTYAERAVLLQRSSATWRMGHGNPTPYELITGSGMPELVDASVVMLRELISDHQKFVFVPSAPAQRHYLTLGNALRPLEYAIIDTAQSQLEAVASGGYRGSEWGPRGSLVAKFAEEIGPEIVLGAFRSSALAPAHLFYAHREHAHAAAAIAIADGALQEHRGFPMLIDIADAVCSSTFDSSSFAASIQAAYSIAGAPYRYLSERQSRTK
ncbi:MAG: hypothetical protein R3C29_04005 [Dehalococcoidia bacterium]